MIIVRKEKNGSGHQNSNCGSSTKRIVTEKD